MCKFLFEHPFSMCLNLYLKSGVAVSYDNPNFLRTSKLFSKCVSLCIPPAMMKFPFLHFLTNIYFTFKIAMAIFVGVKCYSIIFISTSLATTDAVCLLMCLSDISIYSLEKSLCKFFAHFILGLFFS